MRTLTALSFGTNSKRGSYITGVTVKRLRLVLLRAIFDVHVFKLTGLEDFAALFALDEFSILVAAYDLHTRMLTRLLRTYVLWRGGRLRRHISELYERDIG
jgi:hypothetical protein